MKSRFWENRKQKCKNGSHAIRKSPNAEIGTSNRYIEEIGIVFVLSHTFSLQIENEKYRFAKHDDDDH